MEDEQFPGKILEACKAAKSPSEKEELVRTAQELREVLYRLNRDGSVVLSRSDAKRLRLIVNSEWYVQALEALEKVALKAEAYEVFEAGGWFADKHIEQLFDPEDPDHEAATMVGARLLRCGILVASTRLPRRAQQMMLSIRRCYALGLFDAAVILCRTLIDVASSDFVRTQSSTRLTTYPEPKLGARLRGEPIRSAVDRQLLQDVQRAVERGNVLVHRLKVDDVLEKEALQIIRATCRFVEALTDATDSGGD